MDEKYVNITLAYQFLLELQQRRYTELTYEQLWVLPRWRGWNFYHYEHGLKDYSLEVSKLYNN